MSKNNKRPEYVAKLPKTDHNLSHKVKFSSSVGHILPVFHHVMNPGENLKGDVSLFTRTQPLVTAAMVDIEEKVDFFFIPFPYLYTAFEPRMYGTRDYLSSFFDSNQNTFDFPVFRSWDTVVGPDQDFNTFWKTGFNIVDKGNVVSILSASRLLAHLHYNFMMPFNGQVWYTPEDPEPAVVANQVMPAVFPYALLAYHAIYYNFFSNQDFEKREVSFYNWDKYTAGFVTPGNLNRKFFNLHYVSYSEDYFQSSFGTPLLSSLNLINNEVPEGNIQKAMRLYFGLSAEVRPAIYNGSDTSDPEDFVQVSSAQNSDFTLATNQLRANFAMEKYLRVLGRADKTYDAQVLARFGFHVPTDVKHQVQHIGHFASEIHIGEVVSTAQTYTGDSGASLGEIAGKGYGSNKRDNVVDFTAPCHGVVMAVYHARPKQIYNRYGFDRINWMTDASFLWNEEFDNLGAQPIFKHELADAFSGSNYWNPSSRVNDIAAWTDRFHEFKHKYSWASPAFLAPVPYYHDEPQVRDFNAWETWINGMSPLRLDFDEEFSADDYLEGRLVFPSDLDSIFTVPFVVGWNSEFCTHPWLIYQGDPFLHDLDFHLTLWSPMSKTGEPRMDF